MDAVCQRVGKTASTVYRSIQKVNARLPRADFIHFDKKVIKTQFSYLSYIQFVNQLSLVEYHSNAVERIELLFMLAALQNQINKKALYQELGVSATTVKNDRRDWEMFLAKYDLVSRSLARRGTTVIGDEFTIRLQATRRIVDLIELDSDNFPVAHASNSPTRRYVAALILSQYGAELDHAVELYHQFESQFSMQLSYNSKKFLIVYFALSRIRYAHHCCHLTEITPSLFSHQTFPLVEHVLENHQANILLSALTISKGRMNCYHPKLSLMVARFSQQVRSNLTTTIYNDSDFFAELYSVVGGCFCQAALGVWFEDKKLQSVQDDHAYVYGLITHFIAPIEAAIGITLTDNHISTITMVVKKFVVLNKSVDRPRSRLYIVSNSSENKLGYFIEKLKTRFHIEVLGIVNSNEIIHIPTDEYDVLITFTNKIARYLSAFGLSSLKLNYALSDQDYKVLANAGLSRSSRKIPLTRFLSEMQHLSENELKQWLMANYPDHFI
uniref:hypothetical protein n=1 Tax=Thaumasiovibrio occultus TaxID=1891184 RepID=UPI00131B59B8|nr:hypothetical protein [Thaumasiovibrio occultus]